MIRRDPTKFYVCAGTVQCFIGRESPWVMHFFGGCEYCYDEEVLTDNRRQAGQSVCDRLNAGEIDLEQAKQILARVW